MVAKSWTDIRNTRTTSEIPQASLKHLRQSKIKMEHQKKVTYYLKKDNILLIKLLQYIIYKQNGISEKKNRLHNTTIQPSRFRKKIGDVNKDRHEIYEKKY